MIGLVFFIMLGLLMLGIPVAFAILSSGIVFLLTTGLKPLTLIVQRLTTGLDSFPLLAVPLFILVGNLMDSGGISKRLVNWCMALVGRMHGGLGTVTILSCAIFAALTGSGPATVAAIGSIMIPSLVLNGYSKETAAGMAAAAGALGPIIPPSIPMIIYGINMNISVPDMFMGGVFPGLIIAFLLIIVNYIIAIRSPEIRSHSEDVPKTSFKDFIKLTISASGALFLPIIILGGIYGGIFTPTEAAAIGVAYALIVGIFVYREVKIKDLPKILISSAMTAAMVNFIIGAANILSWIMSVTNASTVISSILMKFVTSKFTYLIVLNLFLFFVGALMDTVAAIIIFAPIFVPFGISFGLDPLHIGVLFVINLVIGYVTPPFGYNLFTACSITGLQFNQVVKGVMPFLMVELASIFLFAFVPGIITWLPRLLAG
jgi:C4-dicarboxylate transporter DctM subunit